MANPVWVTQPNLGTFLIGQSSTTNVVATPVSPATSITYSLVDGALPNGLTFTINGVLQGTVSVIRGSTYSFIIKATDNLGNSELRQFYLTVSTSLTPPVWNTPVGAIGSFPALVPMVYQISATPELPATSVTYKIITGALPTGLSMSTSGYISGTPGVVTTNTTSSFTVRATDNLQKIKDRTFEIVISGSAVPELLTPDGTIISTEDSVWIEIPIGYSNIKVDNPILIQVKEGRLPPGLEINDLGVIRGYPEAPIITTTNPQIITNATQTSSTTNTIVVISTIGFTVGRPVVFGGTILGDIISGQTYYVKSILNSTTFTITATQNGPTYLLTTGSGLMTVTLPPVAVGNPTIRTYNFTLELTSPLGNDLGYYSITVINQNTPMSQGGPGKPTDSRLPVLYNTRPPTYNLNANDPYYGYYISPVVSPIQNAYIGKIPSGEYFSWKMIGHDFDGSTLKYSYSNLPLGLTGDTDTGWITGTITLPSAGISSFNFTTNVYKADFPVYVSETYNFSLEVVSEITGIIVWTTDEYLGQLLNGTVSTLFVRATSDVQLKYTLLSGSLPPNLEIADDGEIIGRVSFQPTSEILAAGETSTYEFTVQAYSELYPSVTSSKTFNITILQEFTQPTDTLYIKAAPPIADRRLLQTLLENESLIPSNYLYRANDDYFGKAKSVIYEHAFGIYASDIEKYLEAVTRNHYWRKLTLGQIKTAIARDSNGEILYEVVYSEIIDNLVNPQGISISNQIYWPRPIGLNLGPWYTSITNAYTSYIFGTDFGKEISTENLLPIETENLLFTLTTEQQTPTYYTSLTPGVARVLYPNSLYNMRNRVGEIVGQEFDSRLLPLWMTSQQFNGSTLGYTQAWVIAYAKPGFGEIIKNNIVNNWPHTLNEINFEIDRFTVDKSATYDYNNNTDPASWSELPGASPTPIPLDSKDFYVLFPRQTILPDQTQY